ncbi:amino acid adenylation domain-containing protein [Microbispora sp. H11081]|uniref:amino acid adenylation domain-containing protein n=1 Tax=Microbispora sp. H11081 TaxID=2729107 RepID=UPI0014738934|nr:amino acid adenylation domain-containing protein [Microbispora sp. H11081]
MRVPLIFRPVHERVLGHALTRPDDIAIAVGDHGLSYAELARDAAAVAAALTAGGAAGRPVAVRMDPGPRQAAAVLGALSAGAHLLCLDPGAAGQRGAAVLDDLRPEWLLLDGAQGVHGEPTASGEAGTGDDLADWYRRASRGTVLDVASLLRQAETAAPVSTAPVSTGPGAHGASPDNLMYVAYTSGSTGRPKGIPQTHRGFAQFVTWFAREFRIGPGARVAQWAAPGYDASLVEMFAPLVAGATLCPVPPKLRANPERLAAWLVAEGVTHLQTVPSFARRLLEAITALGPDGRPPALGHLLLAGEPLTAELANGLRAALPGIRLINLYGPTESILATWHEVSRTVEGRVPIGRPIPGRVVLVLDELDRHCPPGVTGELVIRSPYLTPGYAGAAAGERSAFRPPRGPARRGRYYRTGDRGRWTADGVLEFEGRRDFQVKFNGIRLELGDVEAALNAHESVAECAVVAVPGAHRQVASLAAYVVPRATAAEATPAAWRAALRRWFGRAMPPVSFTVVGHLPRTAGGKVDRDRLRRERENRQAAEARPKGLIA